jgi:hypothetical protein
LGIIGTMVVVILLLLLIAVWMFTEIRHAVAVHDETIAFIAISDIAGAVVHVVQSIFIVTIAVVAVSICAVAIGLVMEVVVVAGLVALFPESTAATAASSTRTGPVQF